MAEITFSRGLQAIHDVAHAQGIAQACILVPDVLAITYFVQVVPIEEACLRLNRNQQRTAKPDSRSKAQCLFHPRDLPIIKVCADDDAFLRMMKGKVGEASQEEVTLP